MDPTRLTIDSALALLDAGEVTARDLSDACLGRIERLNPALNAFITICPPVIASGVIVAKQSPLSDIPLAIKDLYDLKGYPTTAGTTYFKDQIAERDGVVVDTLRAAGAVVVACWRDESARLRPDGVGHLCVASRSTATSSAR